MKRRSRGAIVLLAVLAGAGCLEARPGDPLPPTPTPTPFVPATLETCPDPAMGMPGPWTFTEVATAAGVVAAHEYQVPATTKEPFLINTGVAAGDFDDDCFVDLYLVTGDVTPDALLRNQGDGTFAPVTGIPALAGVQLAGGPVFADFTGDGALDLFIGSFNGELNRFLENDGSGFQEILALDMNDHDTYGGAFADYDNDGDLDLFAAHWGALLGGANAPYLWENDDGNFVDRTVAARLTDPPANFVFSPNFTDLDGDGWLDLLIAADFGRSEIFLSQGNGIFDRGDNSAITDENGMGAALGDYDNDGDLDWFVSSIWDPNGLPEANWGVTGNRLYRNTGQGVFEDATDAAGVREGYWGWGSCFADFDNDGWLDLFHTNGYGTTAMPAADEFLADPSRFFWNAGQGTFVEQSAALGIDHTGQGRGIVCFDYDRDGDVDLLIVNNQAAPTLYRNDGGNEGAFLTVLLRGPRANSRGVGARITVEVGSASQIREISAGTNYQSQNPQEAHFGLGTAIVVNRLSVQWPDGRVDTFADVAVDQIIKVVHPEWHTP